MGFIIQSNLYTNTNIFYKLNSINKGIKVFYDGMIMPLKQHCQYMCIK